MAGNNANALAELDELVREIDIDNRRASAAPRPTGMAPAGGAPAAGGAPQQAAAAQRTYKRPIVNTQFFDACPSCHSVDVSTNRKRGFSICETCGWAVDPANRTSKQQRKIAQTGLSAAAQEKLALLQETNIAYNQRILQRTEQANWELFNACQNNDIKTVQRLLDLGYEINCRDTDTGSTPLHWAASKSQQHAIRYLVERGANINAQNKRGLTPLHTLIINRVEPLAFWLIKKGADIRITNNEGHTAVDLALPWTQKEMEELYAKVKAGEASAGGDKPPTIVKQRVFVNDAPEQASDGTEVMKVFLKNDAYKSMVVGPRSIAQDLCVQMAEKLNLGPGFSRNFEVFERVKDGDKYLERRIPNDANVFDLRSKWPLIFGPSGNETHIHCRFIVHIARGSPQDAQVRFREAIYGGGQEG